MPLTLIILVKSLILCYLVLFYKTNLTSLKWTDTRLGKCYFSPPPTFNSEMLFLKPSL